MCPEPPARPLAGSGRRRGGFSLIELAVAIAVVALLASVVLPAYQNSVRKARRTDARAALTTTAQLMERYYTERSTYRTATLGNDTRTTNVSSAVSESGHYRLSLDAQDDVTYTLAATPLNDQANDACGAYTLNEKGLRGVRDGSLAAADCW